MFTNYYKLMNISPAATEEEINAALEKSTLSGALVEEMKMVLQNKSLKALYDEELKLYEASESKQNYEISNATLDCEIKKVKAYISNKARESVTIEEEALSSGRYIPAPECTPDGNGGLAITYRKLQNWSGYQVVNHLSADGTVLSKAVSCNGSTGGDAGSAVIGARGDKALVAWQYRDAVYQLNVNLLSADGSYAWQGDKEYGIAYGYNEQWGFQPVAIIPLANAWVVIYNDLTSWNGGNLMVSKIKCLHLLFSGGSG